MSEPRVVVRQEKRKAKQAGSWGEGATFKVVGWVGLVFALAALGDFALAIYPFGLGNPQWEVGTVAAVVQGFPLLSLGLVGIWLCGGGLGKRRLLISVGIAFLVVAAVLVVMLVLFLTDVPLALRATQEGQAARLAVVKLVLKTGYLAVLFAVLYVIAGVLALRQARGGATAA